MPHETERDRGPINFGSGGKKKFKKSSIYDPIRKREELLRAIAVTLQPRARQFFCPLDLPKQFRRRRDLASLRHRLTKTAEWRPTQ